MTNNLIMTIIQTRNKTVASILNVVYNIDQ